MSTIDYTEIAALLDDLRETCRAVVAGLMEDGFTDREAHAICAGVFASRDTETDEGEQS